MDSVSGDAVVTVVVVGAILVVGSGSRQVFDEYSVMVMMMLMSPEGLRGSCLLIGLVVCGGCVLSAM
jgi:hypothetical protein